MASVEVTPFDGSLSSDSAFLEVANSVPRIVHLHWTFDTAALTLFTGDLQPGDLIGSRRHAVRLPRQQPGSRRSATIGE